MTGKPIITLRLPSNLTIAWSQLLLESCSQAIAHDGPVTFDFENVSWVEPFGLTVVSVALSRCLKLGKDVYYTPPKDSSTREFLDRIGFSHIFLNREPMQARSTSVQLKHLFALDVSYGKKIVDLLAANIALDTDAQFAMQTQINELMTNVFDHSRSTVGCYVCAQFYPQKKLVRLSFADGGIGILGSLKDSGKFPKVKSDIDAIRLAVRPGITTRTTQCGGLGLDIVRRYARQYHGTLSILSGSGKVNFYANKTETKHETIGYEGTIVDIKISTDVHATIREAGDHDFF